MSKARLKALRRAAELVRAAEEERDALIFELVRDGLTYGDVAVWAGCSPATVGNRYKARLAQDRAGERNA